MRQLDIRGNPFDASWILAAMHFPNSDLERRAYYAIKFAETEIDRVALDESINVEARLLRDLVESPSRATLMAEARNRAKHGFVAGDFLLFIFGMHSFPNDFPEPSIRKAVFMSQEFAKHSRFGDGSNLPRSETEIRDCFKQFNSVAHLWAALRLHEAFPIRPQKEIFGSTPAIDDFLAIAATIQDFGCGFVPKRTRPAKAILDVKEIWRVPPKTRRLLPPWKGPPSWLVDSMKGYKART
jgi:hypothetical protein